MEKRTSALSRILATIALAGAALLVIVAVVGSLADSESTSNSRNAKAHQTSKRRHQTTAKAYVVKSGDTLVAIAHRTGVPVVHLLALNPEVDPQILIAGQTLKLR